ncbi:hypothetical protein OZ664_20005 [Elizabethkingia sp. HX WHF]|uniref:hypothetical protein n=1 Tax=Elizabethkingia TaxID=308865 RepID=UPI00099A888D|nr:MULTISPECIES: hypothetical protein [Elizabethkingia]MDV3675108.1 hypothetical protein [Elizabethkingia anophelis]MDV3682184.1 hypothetical protein [Elizabethkingia anophelis]MDV3701840.1 hypothetical protein [Elizabethkingia anophelis]MDV3761146.1 hypothetical protein [Elizabethkingia anophelis]MDV3800342.1 hypothetical protein [Elizabethkingia anophelis]
MNHIFNEIRSERQRQDEKWGQQDHKPIEWVAILTEEVGEVAKEAVDFHFDNNLQGLNALSKFEEQRQRLLNYRKELIQVAAVSVSMIQCLDRHMEALDLI